MPSVASAFARAIGAGGFLAGWRGLRNFWLAIILLSGSTAGLLQILGPPRLSQAPAGNASRSVTPQERAAHTPPSPTPAPVASARTASATARPGRDQPGPTADPDPALLEPLAPDSPAMLPRIAADGRMPMQVYAAGFDRSTRQPKISVLVAGFGLSEADSLRSARVLPGAVGFAVSPYGAKLPPVLAAARAAWHEYLLSIPMEPQGYPLNDPGNQGLMTSLGRTENQKRLFWALSRLSGYVGATGALGDLRGERFAGLSDRIEPVLRQVARRGLLYVDPRPGQPAPDQVWGRAPDLIIDEPPTADAIDTRLGELETIARERGSAFGLAGAPRPVTVDRIAAWTDTLAAKGLVLAPISATVQAASREPVRNAAAHEASRTPATSKAAGE